MEIEKEVSRAASSISTDISVDTPAKTGPLDADVEKQSSHEKEILQAEAGEEETERDPNIVDWDGPDDPENPLNWPLSRKIAAMSVISLITFLSPLASTIISPSTEAIMESFHSTSETLGAFITSVYLLGYTFGPLVIAPMSELYGRSKLYNVCNIMFVIFNIACAVAPSLNSLIVFRFFTGIAASSPMTLGAGSIADMIPLEKRGLAMVTWVLGPVLGPSTGPLAGAYLTQAKGWRWVFWLLTMVGGTVAIVALLFIQESYPYTLLQKKTERLRKETGNPNLRSALDTGKHPKDLFKFSIVRPLKMLFFSPIVFLLSLYMAIVYGYLYLLFTTFPRVFQGQYHFSDTRVGLVYLGIGVGSFFGLFFTAAVSDRTVKMLTKRNGGAAKPEYRLPPLILGTLLVPVGLFLYGWTAEKKVHWMAPIVGTAILGAAMFNVMMPCSVYLVDAFTIHAASATAAGTVFRSLLGALLPLAGNKMYNALGIGWGTSLLGFIAVAFIPVPFIFYIYGERIRESKLFSVKF